MIGENIVWTPGVTLEHIEKQVILKAFKFYRSNKTSTSQALGISIRTLDSKLEKYEIEEKEMEKANEHRSAERTRLLERSRGVVTVGEGGTSVLGANAGVRVEPAAQDSAQPSMPVPKRAQVQTVLPGPIAKSSTGKAR